MVARVARALGLDEWHLRIAVQDEHSLARNQELAAQRLNDCAAARTRREHEVPAPGASRRARLTHAQTRTRFSGCALASNVGGPLRDDRGGDRVHRHQHGALGIRHALDRGNVGEVWIQRGHEGDRRARTHPWYAPCSPIAYVAAGSGWEYKLVSMGNPLQPEVEERANAFGRLGELVTIDAGAWVFKRPAEVSEETAEAAVELAVPVTTVETLSAPPRT